jgi:peptide/nickel transport system permease protein
VDPESVQSRSRARTALGPAARFVLGRLAQAALVLWGAVTVTFVALQLLPGDPVSTLLGPMVTVTPQVRAQIVQDYQLNRPVLVQYADYLRRLLTGNLGTSYQQELPVRSVIGQQLGPTLQLAACAAVLGALLAVAAALPTAGRPGPARRLVEGIELLAVSTPTFWLGILLLTFFSFRWQLFPVAGADGPDALVLPAVTLAVPMAGLLSQVLRAGLEAALEQPFTLAARARGVGALTVRGRHALRHALIPAITLGGWLFGGLLGGTVMVETVFARPGLGRVAVTAIDAKDMPVVLGVVLVSAVGFVVVNTAVDLLYAAVDPRLRGGRVRP